MATSYKFDFNAEVARAKANFPEKTRNTVFVNTGAPDAEKIIRVHVRDALLRKTLPMLEKAKVEIEKTLAEAREKKSLSPAKIRRAEKEYRLEYRKARRVMAKGIAQTARRMLKTQNFTQPWPSRPGHYMIGVNGKKAVAGVLDFATPEKEKFFAFWHEVGHRVAQTNHTSLEGKAKMSARTARGERCADAFAMLTGLRRRVLTLDDARKIVHNHVCSALTEFDEEHLTAPALEKIARGSVKHARKLTPEKTAEAAREIAKRAPVRVRDMEKLNKLNNKFFETCDIDALAEYLAVSETRPGKKPLTPMQCLERSPAFQKNVSEIFGKFAARAKKDSVERRYCDSLVKTAAAAGKSTQRPRW
jgi:hypothetical protein